MKKNWELKELLTDSWKPKEHAVILFLRNGHEILLIHKKTGLGKGLINGPGGRVEKNESYEDAALRELEEEVCMHASNLEFSGTLNFQFLDGYSMKVKVFQSHSFSGIPSETREAKPQWFNIESIPYDQMWMDDRLWFPLMLEKKSFEGYFIFQGERMLDYQLNKI